MIDETDFELVRGSGNIFRDLGLPTPDLQKVRAILAAAILKALDARGWSVQEAEAITDVSHKAFARIRRAQIRRFSIERLAAILNAMRQEVELAVQVRPRQAQTPC